MQIADRPIFITARFRTGSTLLWHLFRQLKNFTTYYEPCHDNLVEHVRGNTPAQESHYGVDSYWDEYRPLMDRLPDIHRNDFGVCRLILEASDVWPELESYIRFLIDRSKPRRPVLQFNRVDFRLPWLRKVFPEAIILHLFRDPRDQWLSMVRDLPATAMGDPDENTNYDLLVWAVSLSASFPFLVGPHITHSYERHYLIWKLSYLMGARCADVSLSYDRDFQEQPERGLDQILKTVGAGSGSISQLASGIVRRPVRSTPAGAPSARDFERMETACDELLRTLGLEKSFGSVPLKDIRHEFESSWNPFAANAPEEAARLSCLTFSRFRSHYLNTVSDMRLLGQNARNVEKALADRERQLREILNRP